MTAPHRLGPLTLGLVALLSTPGCSWIFVQPLPPDHGSDYQPCTSSRAAPVVDTILTITNLASALYVASENNVTNKDAAVTLGIGVGILWALSAGYGYSRTAECEEAHELEEHGYRPPPHLRAPPRYYPQPPPRVVDPAAAPAAAPPPVGAPQQGDDGDPSDRRAPPPSASPAPKEPPEHLDTPRFGD